jgi:hypothetical protein
LREQWPTLETLEGGRLDLRQWWSTAEWWTYHPSSFLMFSPRIYWRLFESINAAYAPVAGALIALSLLWLALRTRRLARDGSAGSAAFAARLPLAVLAACWLFVAWVFLLERFAPINWPARYFAAGFVLQAALLGALAASNGLCASGFKSRSIAGLGLALWALLAHPLLALAFGRPWRQAEVFGLAPDPTVIATLAVLMLVEVPESSGARRLLRVATFVPIAWCAMSAATLATMGSGQAWVVLAAAIAYLLCLRSTGRSR